MNFYAKGFSVFFAAVGLSLLFCFSMSPWREKQFDDFVAISSTSVDLGQVVCFEKANGEFTLTNLTSAPIPFRVAADCSCTTIASPSGVIEPSAAHVVKFTYSPKSIAALASSIHKEGSDITVSLAASQSYRSFLLTRIAISRSASTVHTLTTLQDSKK